MQGAFSGAVFESLALSSESFSLVADTGAVHSALLQASLAAGSVGSRREAAAAAEAFAAMGPASGPIVPVDYLSRTYVQGIDGYEYDAARTGAPANGVRFILYEIDPITREPGATEIGYVDLLDESSTLAYVIRVLAVTGGVERINYTVSAVIGVQTLGFIVSGFISDGTDMVDVDLSMTFVNALPVTTATVDHLISVLTRDFTVDATVVFTFNSETLAGSIDIDATFMQGAHTVRVAGVIKFVEGTLPTEGRTVEIYVDEQLFAVVTVSGETITVQNATGGELTNVEAQAVRKIFDRIDDMFDDRFEDFIRPVSWLFWAK